MNRLSLFSLLFILFCGETFCATDESETSADNTKLISEIDIQELVEQAKFLAMNTGLITRTPEHLDKSDVAQFVPFALMPSPFPRELYSQAQNIQKAMNLLYFRISLNNKFLEETLQAVAETNVPIQGLLNIQKEVTNEGIRQPITLLLERSDYMVHVNKNDQTNEENFELKQIEVNIGQMGGPARADRITELHRHFMQNAGHDLANMPENGASTLVAEGLHAAWKSFGDPTAIIVVVAAKKYQNFEQYQLSESVRKISNYKIKVVNLALGECGEKLTLDENDFKLRFKGKTVALVYHKTVIVNPTPALMSIRHKIERSTAIKCPTVALELACSKKVQQVLALPGVVEQFFFPTAEEAGMADSIRRTFAGLWGLEKDDEPTRKIIEDAIINPDNYVLKPSMEGGGNNYWGKQIAQKLKTFKPDVRAAHILMQKISPMPCKNFLVRPFKPTKLEGTVSELSIYGYLIGDAHHQRVLHNERRGFMLRTKLETTNEGGIGAGGGYHDSPYLF